MYFLYDLGDSGLPWFECEILLPEAPGLAVLFVYIINVCLDKKFLTPMLQGGDPRLGGPRLDQGGSQSWAE